ncbi:Asparagine--tRNA ligase [Hondaea fermentalgiana]|uniref:asparagine--tRNA ligase n=1 Tax=Hondaea fermentalgiana TaxID=2315210 RepID=A0A2R5GIM3_9STRA|nr:Asparagine--tRNA ligase [Hondaea fermentalgiana]|eukprot:GBG29578.1 Asparagine--tRNA ligase [Hondaea fermentalgiana]
MSKPSKRHLVGCPGIKTRVVVLCVVAFLVYFFKVLSLDSPIQFRDDALVHECRYLDRDAVAQRDASSPWEKKKLRIGLLTFSHNSDPTMLRLSIRNKREYAEHHGYDLIEANDEIDLSRPPAWSKLTLLSKYLPSYDFMVWVDHDAIFMNMTIGIEDLVDANHELFFATDQNGINSGVFIVHNSDWTMWWLQECWKQEWLIKGQHLFKYEQRAMHYLYGTDIFIEEAREHNLPPHPRSEEVRAKTATIDACALNANVCEFVDASLALRRGNDCSLDFYRNGDFIVHFAGKGPLYNRSQPRCVSWRSSLSTTNTSGEFAARPDTRRVKDLLASGAKYKQQTSAVRGWVKSVRRQKTLSFVQVSDGSSWESIQIVIPTDRLPANIGTGASVYAQGVVQQSPRGQVELSDADVDLIGACDGAEYPLQKKYHSPEFLRDFMHLRPRSNLMGAVLRVRSKASLEVHKFFAENDFTQIHTPVLTSIDCEGAGDMFPVDQGELAQDGDLGTFLTVSGQLHLEPFACSLSKVYTFGPAFRAENSHTTKHLSEFWMLEPEVAFHDLEDSMALAEDCVKHIIGNVVDAHADDLDHLFALHNQKKDSMGTERWDLVQRARDKPFLHMTYDEAIDILEQAASIFSDPVVRGMDLQTEHERFLVDKYCQGQPLFVTHYPAHCKAFYMKPSEDRADRVNCFDLLIPRIGELVGGSEREDDFERLDARVGPHSREHMQWYLDLRRYGSVPHAGWGLGFERLVQFVTGVSNIRETSAMPRWAGSVTY